MKKIRSTIYIGLCSFIIINSCFNIDSSSNILCKVSIGETNPFIVRNNQKLPLKFAHFVLKLNAIVGYNSASHRFDIWDMENNEAVEEIYLKKEGPEGIVDIKSFYLFSRDTIIVLTDFALYIINSNSEILDKIIINRGNNNFTGINFDSLQIFNDANNRNPIYYVGGHIYFSVKEYNNNFYDYDHPIIGKLNLKDKSSALLPIKHDSRYRNSSYGLFDKPNITYTKSIIVVNFPIANDIYFYDYNGNLIKHAYPKGQYSYLECKPYIGAKVIDDLNIENHLNSNPTYYPVIYLEKSRKYLRIHRPPVQEDKEKYYLTVYSGEVDPSIPVKVTPLKKRIDRPVKQRT